MTRNKRHSSATAYLRRTKHVKILTGAHVDRLIWAGDRAAGVVLVDGRELRANKVWCYAQAQLLRLQS